MKQIILKNNNSYGEFLYKQLYLDIKDQISEGEMVAGEKCPSIRALANELNISVTTVMQAYNQLLSEGYISNKPGSGYYVEEGLSVKRETKNTKRTVSSASLKNEKTLYIYDDETFDFVKWKKCSNKIYTEFSNDLLYESDIKGEYELRLAVANYLHTSRGVNTSPDNIIIGAGTQQIAFHLARILKKDGVNIISLESPGYGPVKSVFIDSGMNTIDIPVTDAGVDISLLPINIKSGVYVNPSNQFPTGVVMPASKRYEILEWAEKNNCYVIEDDYNSELRYFGQPLSPIKSLDKEDRVIYLGSFSSTLFPAIRISYMVLTDELTKVFELMEKDYTQTCSKAEQLTLAQYMNEGFYYTNIRKKRSLYTKKLNVAINAFEHYGKDFISLTNIKSGLTLTLNIRLESKYFDKSNNVNKDMTHLEYADRLILSAKQLGVKSNYIKELSDDKNIVISLYYSSIPLDKIDEIIKNICDKWKNMY